MAGEGAEGPPRAGDHAREVAGAGAEQGVGHLGAVAASVAAVLEGAVEAFGAGLAFHFGKLGGVFGRGRFVGQRFAEALQHAAEVGAHGRLQGGEDFVELDADRGAADRDRRAAVHLRRAGAARVEFDEEVALEEDPWPDLGVGVVVDRPPVAFDGKGDVGVVAVAADFDHFADFDPGDPHRRVGRDVGAVGEGRLQGVAVAGERDVAGEGQVGPDREDEDEDHRDRGVARPPLEAPVGGSRPGVSLGQAAHPFFFVAVVLVPQCLGDVADHGLARDVALVARFADAALAGARVGVEVQVVADFGPVGRRRGGRALGVGPVRRLEDDRAQPVGAAVGFAEGVGEVLEGEAEVVAGGLRGSDHSAAPGRAVRWCRSAARARWRRRAPTGSRAALPRSG